MARRGLAISDYVNDSINAAHVNLDTIESRSLPDTPPWTLDAPDITVSLGSVTKNDQPLLVGSIAKEKIDTEFAEYQKIYTDGSKLDDGRVGCAFVIPDKKITNKYRLNNNVSIFSAEIFAISQALSYLESLDTVADKAVILSDSKSALQALENRSKSSREAITQCRQSAHDLLQRGCQISFCWIPSHVNIPGNELADRAAKEAAVLVDITNDIGFSVSEIYSKLNSEIKTKWKQFFSTLALQKHWVEPYKIDNGIFPKLPLKFFPTFYRLRTGAFRADYVPQNCVCNSVFNSKHLFECNQLRTLVPKTMALLGPNTNSLQSVVLSGQSGGWRMTETFIRELNSSPVGAFI